MNTQHTPGHVIALYHHRHGINVEVIPADANPEEYFPDRELDREDEWIETMELAQPFASAPALLAALESVVRTVDNLQAMNANLGLAEPGDTDEVWEQARSALALARGTAPAAAVEDKRDAEVKRLREALREMFELVEDQVLVRNTERDNEAMHFIKQGIRITAVLARADAAIKGEARATLAESEAGR